MKNYKFTLTVDVVYTNKTDIRQSYNLDWDFNKKGFERHMTDIMSTIAIGEEPGTIDCINIISIEFKDRKNISKEHIDEIKNFIDDTDIKCNI